MISAPRKAAIWYMICSFVQKGISTITVPIFTRILSTAEYGKYNVFNTWLGILSIFLTLSIYQGVYMQGIIKYSCDKDIYTSSLQGLTLTLVAAWSCIYICCHNFWNNLFGLDTLQMSAIIILSWCSAVFGFWATEQRVQYRYMRLVIITIAVAVAKPAISIFLVLTLKDKVAAMIIGMVLVEVLAYGGLFLLHMKKGKTFFSKRYWLYVVSLAIPLIPHYLSATILSGADRIMIQSMVNDSAAGIYSLAYSVAMIMIIINNSLIEALNPWLYQRIKDGKIKDMGKVAYPSLAIIAVANLLLIAFAPEIIKIFAPQDYYSAIYVVPPAAMSVYFMFLYQLFACFEFYFEYTQYIAGATIVAALANIILNYIFINIFGYYAAGYTTLVCYAIFAFSHYYFMRRVCKIKLKGEKAYIPRILFSITVVFLMIGFMFLFLYEYKIIRYMLLLFIIAFATVKREKIFAIMSELLGLRNLSEE